jgi:hypothetical protein
MTLLQKVKREIAVMLVYSTIGAFFAWVIAVFLTGAPQSW